MLKGDIKELKTQINNSTMEQEKLTHQNVQLFQQVETLVQQQERLVGDHMRETTDLRETISILTEQLKSQPINWFSQFMSEMDNPNMDSDFDSFIMVDDSAVGEER